VLYNSPNPKYEQWNGYAGNKNGRGIMDEHRFGYPSQNVDRKIDSPQKFTQI
jgi:hypothetical protein